MSIMPRDDSKKFGGLLSFYELRERMEADRKAGVFDRLRERMGNPFGQEQISSGREALLDVFRGRPSPHRQSTTPSEPRPQQRPTRPKRHPEYTRRPDPTRQPEPPRPDPEAERLREELAQEKRKREQAESAHREESRARQSADTRASNAEDRARQAQRERPKPSSSENPLQKAYSLLGVSSSATKADIKAAYQHLIYLSHPDRAGNNEARSKFAEERTKEINEAFQLIKKRRSF